MMVEPLIRVQKLEKRFGAIAAVRGIDLTVARGEVLGFLGPNGAGKSTTMRMITGYLAPSTGTVTIAGNDMARSRLAAQRLIGYLPEGAPTYPDMTPRAYLGFVAEVYGLGSDARKAAVAAAVAKTELEDVLDRPIETLSKGFKRRVGLAQSILHDPPVLILDEPTDGLDPNQKHAVRALIKAMASEKAIVISTHILEEVEAVCSRAVIIDRGRIVADGTPAALMARSRYHNAVTIVVEERLGETVRAALGTLDRVAAVESTRGPDGLVRLTAFPKGEGRIIEQVAGLVAAHGWAVSGLYAETGRLDEVFRALTTSDTRGVRGGEHRPPVQDSGAEAA